MNGIWDIVLRARKSGNRLEELKFIKASCPSPYMESAFDIVNTKEIIDTDIEINLIYRFSEVFSALLMEENFKYEKTREIFIDVILHCVAVWDLRNGYDKREYQAAIIIREILEQRQLSFIGNEFSLFRDSQMKKIIFYLLDLYKNKDYLFMFKKALKEVFPKSNIYENTQEKKEVLLYIGKEKNEVDIKKIDILSKLFLPISYKIEIFWDKHFGIIEVDESMIIGDMAVY
jgi:hypothetical protein